jgi:hypothetical protein
LIIEPLTKRREKKMASKECRGKTEVEKRCLELLRDAIRKFREYPGPSEPREADQVFTACAVKLSLVLDLMRGGENKLKVANLMSVFMDLYALACEPYYRGEEANFENYADNEADAEAMIKGLIKIWPELAA